MLDSVIGKGEPEKAWKTSENLKPPKTARSRSGRQGSLAEGHIPDAGDDDVLGLVGGGDGTLDGVRA